MSNFHDPDTGKLDATLIADYIAFEPTPLGRGADGEMYVYQDGIYVREERIVAKRVASALKHKHSRTVLGQVEDHLLNVEIPDVGLPDLPSGFLEYVVLENGIYWWRSGDLEPHSAALGAMSRLPIAHDPIAKPHSFLDWLGQVLGDDPHLHRHLWEIIGYLLMTGNPFQKIFMIYGPGGNGKGTLLRVLRAMLGRENYSSISMHQLVENQFAASGLYGKIANISGDLSSKFLSDPQILKEISGGDSITASRKFGQFFEFVPYAVPVFASNEFFRTSDTSIGWRRRWEVIEFTRDVLAGGRPFDEGLLFEDVPGIFNYAMEGLRRLMARGRFDPPQSALDATARLHDEADPVLTWLDDDEHVDRDPDAVTPHGRVYDRYKGWCSRNGYTPLNLVLFGKRLAQLGIESTRPRTTTGRGRCYRGLDVQEPFVSNP